MGKKSKKKFKVCPMCKKATKKLHPDDGLCPKCEEEWAEFAHNWAKEADKQE